VELFFEKSLKKLSSRHRNSFAIDSMNKPSSTKWKV
jgi:hypothetical protein